jgi:hypothetical protein
MWPQCLPASHRGARAAIRRTDGFHDRAQVSEPLGDDHQLLGVMSPLAAMHQHVCQLQGKFDDEVRRLARLGAIRISQLFANQKPQSETRIASRQLLVRISRVFAERT